MAAYPHSIYSDITNQIVAAIEAGQTTQELPWHNQGLGAPRNLVTHRPYRGINAVLLWLAGRTRAYGSCEWATFQQWRERGCSVLKGEKATSVVFWKTLTKQLNLDDEPMGAAEAHGPLLARTYYVFNASQVDGYGSPSFQPLSQSERVSQAEAFFASVNADVQHGASHAFYSRDSDSIHMPDFELFRDAVDYYATRAHETVHWTGAQHRLERDLTGRFGSGAYAMEELVAELGAAFLCGALGLTAKPRPDHAGYIASWLQVLKDDRRAIFTAASRAQQAADWLLQAWTPPPLRDAALELPRGLAVYRRRRHGGGTKTLYI